MTSADSSRTFHGWNYYANANALSHTNTHDWKQSLEIVSEDTRHLILNIETEAYKATKDGLDENERHSVAQYLVRLGLIGDLSKHSKQYLFQYAHDGRDGIVRGLNLRSTVYQGAAASFEAQWAPAIALEAHYRLVRCLRDFAAIDRRAANELRVHGNLGQYKSGEAETKDVTTEINSALSEIKNGISTMFSKDDLDSVILRIIKSTVDN